MMIRPKPHREENKKSFVLLLRTPLRTLFCFGAALGRGRGRDRAAPSVIAGWIRPKSSDKKIIFSSLKFLSIDGHARRLKYIRGRILLRNSTVVFP
jgi:hypothetical protein